MQGSNIACVFTLCLDFRRLWKFTNGRTQHILILFRNGNVLLSQESVIYSQSHWVAAFPEHRYFAGWCDPFSEPSLCSWPVLGPWGISPTQRHAFISTITFSLQGSPCLGSPWMQRLIGQHKSWAEEAWKVVSCNILPGALMHMLFSLYKESVAYLEI